ncbi:MAG: tetratricopeptide repeat protein [Candidatus Margulisiibacteriota bacterium]
MNKKLILFNDPLKNAEEYLLLAKSADADIVETINCKMAAAKLLISINQTERASTILEECVKIITEGSPQYRSIKFYNQIYVMYLELDDDRPAGQCAVQIAQIYHYELRDAAKAIEYYEQAAEFYRHTEQDSEKDLPEIYKNLGDCYLSHGDKETAEKNYALSLEHASVSGKAQKAYNAAKQKGLAQGLKRKLH